MNTVEDLKRFMYIGPSTKFYVDGVKVDIDTLDELPDVLIMISRDYRSHTFVRTSDGGFVSHYYIFCCSSQDYKRIDIGITAQSSKTCVNRSVLLYEVIGNDIHEQYGDGFPSNLDVLYRLVKVADKTINKVFNKDKLMSQFYGISTKSANH